MKQILLTLMLFAAFRSFAQQIKVEVDKAADFSQYKTFRFGEGQITTPKDERAVPDATMHEWIKQGITEELTEKGLKLADSADLVVSYLIGSEKRTDAGSVGPLGMTPGSSSSTYIRDYQQGSFVIDLNDTRSNKLMYRINAVTSTNQQDGDKMIDEIIERGFKKFSLREKKHKKQK